MNVYAWAKQGDAPEICIMQWRKPYELADWLLDQLPEDEAQAQRDENGAFSVQLTAQKLTQIMTEAKIGMRGDVKLDNPDQARWVGIWKSLTEGNFNWRAQEALKAGYEIEIFVSP